MVIILAKVDTFLVEQNILSILLQKPRLIHKVTSQIQKDYFSDNPNRKQNKAIFMTMDYISRKTDVEELSFDSMTILSVVNKYPALSEALKNIFPKQEEFVQYIETLKKSPIDPSNLNIHMEELKKINIVNELSTNLELFNNDMLSSYNEWDKDEIINKAENKVLDVSNKYNSDESQIFVEANKPRLERYKNAKPNDNKFAGLATPFDRLNRFSGGLLREGSVTVVNALSNVGKSLFLKDVAMFLAIKHKVPVYLGANEMTPEENEERIIKSLTGLPMIIIENRLYNSPEDTIKVENKVYKTKDCRDKVLKAVKQIDESPLYFDQIRAYTPSILANRANYFKKRHNIQLFVFDYVKESTSVEAQEKALRHFLGSVVGTMKEDIADRLKIPVLTSCQASDSMPFKPTESRDIFRFSTAFLTLRRLNNNEKRPFDGDYGISLQKNRYGRVHADYKKTWISFEMDINQLRFKEVNY